MFHYLDKYARDDSIVKAVFDHLRNMGLVTLILGASAWKEKHIGAGWVAVWDYLTVAVLVFFGFALMWLNHENLFHKLRNSGASNRLKFLIALLYAVIFAELLRYAEAGRV